MIAKRVSKNHMETTKKQKGSQNNIFKYFRKKS